MAFNRMFGKAKKEEPAPSLTDQIAASESRQDTYQKKIDKLDVELRKYNEQMRKMRDGPQKNMVKKRALRVLKQKRQFEQQLDNCSQVSYNMMNIADAQQNIKDTATTVAAMKAGAQELKAGMAKVNIDAVEDLQDEMEDLLADSNEMQEILSRSYDGVEVDDADLEAELDALGDYDFDQEVLPTPGLLEPDIGATPQVDNAQVGPAVDAFGLAELPS